MPERVMPSARRAAAASIVLVTGNHLCHNPRALKEANLLARAGFDVEVLGAWVDKSLRERDREMQSGLPFRYTPVQDLASTGALAQVERLVARAKGKAGRMAYRLAGLQGRWQLGQVATSLEREALQRRADLYIAHSEPALVAADALLASGRRVGVDMEDWFSEDLLPEARASRPIRLLRELEAKLLRGGAHATCPSHAMSAALAAEHGCPPPAVIYNAFPWSDRQRLDGARKDRRQSRSPSIHWYSQTIGPGRGLEDLFAALPQIGREAELHLRGMPVAGFDSWLATLVPAGVRARVFVHDTVANGELLSRIAEHDIGFAGEMRYCRSRDLTVTNKILHYLLAGLAVVASDTVGQREVAERSPQAVSLYPCGDPGALANRINALLDSPAALAGARAAALTAAQHEFCWEHQEGALLEAVSRALGAGRMELPDATP